LSAGDLRLLERSRSKRQAQIGPRPAFDRLPQIIERSAGVDRRGIDPQAELSVPLNENGRERTAIDERVEQATAGVANKDQCCNVGPIHGIRSLPCLTRRLPTHSTQVGTPTLIPGEGSREGTASA
jgi:hypothetical protein